MKHFSLLLLVLVFSSPASAANITVDEFFHNPLVLDAKNIALYRKLGCIFDNKFYSEGAVLKFPDGNSRCKSKNDLFFWGR